ncbi:MAG: extracellular solute-binding protein, partial [Actinobacteria bacterium]|nr:extracellular solute-binding protein [Actinomycetota bacterium]
MNRRAYLTGVVVTSAVLALAACSSSSSGGSGSGSGSKTLVVQGNQYSIPVFEQVGKLFEQQNPGVKITYQTLNDQQESTTNLQVLTSSAAPDIADLPTNTTVYTEMIKNNQLLPLDDVWQADNLEAGYGEPLASSLKANGTPYVICYSRTLYGVVWYNKSIFSKLGIDVPADHQIASMDNLQKITDTLRSGGYQPLAVGGASDYQLTWILDSLLPTSASPTQLTNYTTNYQASVPVTAQYTDPAFTAVLERLKQMYDDKVFQDGVLGMDQTADLALFAAGKAGMVMGHNLT